MKTTSKTKQKIRSRFLLNLGKTFPGIGAVILHEVAQLHMTFFCILSTNFICFKVNKKTKLHFNAKQVFFPSIFGRWSIKKKFKSREKNSSFKNYFTYDYVNICTPKISHWQSSKKTLNVQDYFFR